MLIPQVLGESTTVERVKHIGCIGLVQLVISCSNTDYATKELLDEHIVPKCRVANCIVGTFRASSDADVDAIAHVLNKGAMYVQVKGTTEEILDLIALLPKGADRLIVQTETVGAIEERLIDAGVGGFVVVVQEALSTFEVKAIGDRLWDKVGRAEPKVLAVSIDSDLCISLGNEKVEALVGEMHRGCGGGFDHPIHIETWADIPEMAEKKNIVSIGNSLLSCLNTDRLDGLYTTVVTDEFGIALGLVYSSKESILSALNKARGVYWSRSRGELWEKGSTGGAYQELCSLTFDCDGDALRFSVIQRGDPPSFCHRKCRSCWGEDQGLYKLFRTIQARKADAPEGSYTKRLFEDMNLLRNKILEEGQELMEAVEANDRVSVAEETADLLYFCLTACCAGDATLKEVSDVLDRRSLAIKRRPGNAKQYRIEAATKILQDQNK